jgi:hypothetical protein
MGVRNAARLVSEREISLEAVLIFHALSIDMPTAAGAPRWRR